MGASVTVMLSYDYCHFEVSKSTDEEVSNVQIDEMRKDCQRLADKAIRQYQIHKKAEEKRSLRHYDYEKAKAQVERILQKAEGDRTVNEMAIVKQFKDTDWAIHLMYDYQDEWEEEEADEH